MSLFRRKGYALTSLNDIVALSGAPKGSLYHYFPRGKASIAEAAVVQAGANLAATLQELALRHATAGELVRAYADLLTEWMTRSRFSAGSSIATTLLAMAPADKAVTRAGRESYAVWRKVISPRLIAQGCSAQRADRLTDLVVSALDGALTLSRIESSASVLQRTALELEALLDSAVAAPERTARQRA
jgi:TetR/AcrR family transcriptional repressor of lmrAB and yxaGH operons